MFDKTGFLSNTKINGINIQSKECNPSQYEKNGNREVNKVIIHYTGCPKDTALAEVNYFHVKTTVAKSSAHFFVDDTEIWQSVKLCDTAWHAGNDAVSRTSYGIEMCCTAGNYRVGEKAKENSVHLAAWLLRRMGYNSNNYKSHIFRHYDITGKLCPAQMAGEYNKEWEKFVEDVGKVLSYDEEPLAESHDEKYRGTYKTKAKGVWLRKTPEVVKFNKKKSIAKNKKVLCYGNYTKTKKGTIMLLCQYGDYVGFIIKGRLIKC